MATWSQLAKCDLWSCVLIKAYEWWECVSAKKIFTRTVIDCRTARSDFLFHRKAVASFLSCFMYFLFSSGLLVQLRSSINGEVANKRHQKTLSSCVVFIVWKEAASAANCFHQQSSSLQSGFNTLLFGPSTPRVSVALHYSVVRWKGLSWLFLGLLFHQRQGLYAWWHCFN